MEQRNTSRDKSHFTEEGWSDFIRGVPAESKRMEMQAHLDAGCVQCRSLLDRLTAVAKLAAADNSLTIPDEVLQHARGIFEPAPQTGWIDTLEAITAELISSVRNDWQLAGVRSLEGAAPGSVGDRLLFRAGEYSVDVKLEPPWAGEAGEIIGQIANLGDRAEILEGVLVQMVAAGRTIGETSTNRFGEFLMDYPAKKSATLRFALKQQGRRIDLPLRLGDSPVRPLKKK